MMTHPVFISYRRETGHQLANLVASELQRRGYTTYMDVLRPEVGRFWEHIQSAIRASRALVLICTNESFATETTGNDWVAREVEEALACKRPIIPFFATNFVQPMRLPDAMAKALEYSGVRMDAEFPDATFDRLCKLLGPSRKLVAAKALMAAAAVIIAAFLGYAWIGHSLSNGAEKGTQIVRPLELAGAWPTGTNIQIGFLNGSAAQQQKVQQVSREWLHYANLTFTFSDLPAADARIIFSVSNIAAWSFRGTEAHTIPPNCPTMMLVGIEDNPTISDYDRRAILHEFGHLLGLLDEIQNPNGKIPWSPAVRADASITYNYISRVEKCPAPLNRPVTYQDPLPNYRAFDPVSIMMVDLPQVYLTEKDISFGGSDLSASDKDFVMRLYPKLNSAPGDVRSQQPKQ